MRGMILMAGVAALAATIPAAANDPDRGHGRGHDAQAAEKGDGKGRRRSGETRAERGPARSVERALSGQERRVEQAIRQEQRQVERARDMRQDVRQARGVDARDAGEAGLDPRDWRGWSRRRADARDRFGDRAVPFRPFPDPRAASARAACPPGLARQNRFCLPPGQLRRARFIGRPLALAARPYNVPARYAYRFADDDRFLYRYDQGTIFGFDRSSGLVSRVVPLVSTGLFPGEPVPLGYDVYNVPVAYRAAFPDSGEWLHRYDGDAIYRVDAESGLVDGIVALLAGAGGLGGLGVGDRLPTGYDAYNVPLDYRASYQDGAEALYRYADESIYQVDPRTRMIESVISMLG